MQDLKVAENGSISAKFTAAYAPIVLGFDPSVDASKYKKVVFNNFVSEGEITFKVWQVGEVGENYNPAIVAFNQTSATGTNIELSVTGATAAIEKIEIASANGGECVFSVDSVTFK